METGSNLGGKLYLQREQKADQEGEILPSGYQPAVCLHLQVILLKHIATAYSNEIFRLIHFQKEEEEKKRKRKKKENIWS